MRDAMVPLVFWCATAFFLICAYPMSPPGEVPGLSANLIANVLFLISTCCLIIYVFSKGKSCRGCARKERIYKRAAYTWLCVIILCIFLAVNDLVRRGPSYISPFLIVVYGVILLVLMGVFFMLRYWKERAGKD